MSYGHAERNLALIRQLEAETRQLFATPVPPVYVTPVRQAGREPGEHDDSTERY